jgi:hypothetical protein
MGDTSLKIKDGLGSGSALSTFTSSVGLIPEHAIYGTASVSAPSTNPLYVTASSQIPVSISSNTLALGSGVPITASQTYPVYVTGSVSISQPVNVDLTIADNVSVTSSITNPLYISSSANSPILITGTVDAGGTTLTNIKSLLDPLFGMYLSTGGKNYLLVTSSATGPVYVSSSATSPLTVTGTVDAGGSLLFNIKSLLDPLAAMYLSTGGKNYLLVTSSTTSPVYVSSSAQSPITITGTVALQSNLVTVTSSTTNPVAAVLQDSAVSIAGTASVAINSVVTVTSSNLTPLIVAPQKSVADSTRDVHNLYGSINYENYSSGTFVIASSSYDRKGLVISNNSSNNLYVVIGSSSDGPNGFQLSTTASAPLKFSFILYPSGTYFAESVFVSQFHAGFFPSSSDPGWYPETISTKVN